MMQVQVVLVHISMATTITFVIHLVMKGKSPPSNMCTTATNDIYEEVRYNNDGVHNYITKASIFDLQQQMEGAQSRLRERIKNLSIDIRHSEARKRDYIDNKLSAQKEEQDARIGP